MTINRTAMIDYVDARIAQTSNPRHVEQLQVLRAHMAGEVSEDVDALLATISPLRQQYRTWGAPEALQPTSREAIRAFYFERQALGQLYFQFDIDRLAVADDIIITDGVMTSLVAPDHDVRAPRAGERETKRSRWWVSGRAEVRSLGCHMTDVERVLIAGGGISGLTLAAALHRDGLDVELVELEREWNTSGAGLSVQPNGLRVLKSLGLDARIADAGCVISSWLFADDQGGVLCRIDLDSVWGEVGPLVGITRARLQDVLVAGAQAVPCRLGTSIISIGEATDGVSVRFTDGSTGDYDLVVGADGIRSAVRALVFGPVEPTFAGHISWRSVAPMRLPGPPSVQFWLGDRCFFGLCPVGDDRTYGFGHVTQERRYDPVEGRLGRLRERFAGFGPTVQDYLAALDDDAQIHCSAIEWIDQEQWHTGRVVLIGDAAHASSPLMGQGGSLAMEDASVLAEVLRTEPTLEQGFAAYTRRRAPRVWWVQAQSRAVAGSLNLPPHTRNKMLRGQGERMFHERYAPLALRP